jgi:superfamily II DNA or RNA helicase
MSQEELLTGLDIEALYEGWGVDVLEDFVTPALRRSYHYDRLTAYFTLNSMLAVAEGIETLWRRGGEMRLVIGIHDVPPEIAEAGQLDEADVEDIVTEVRTRLLEDASTIEDEFRRDRLATLAWMLNDGLLQVRIACPVRMSQLSGGGIFHKKRLIFRDVEDNTLVAVGSPNETVAGFHENIEELTVLKHWEDGQRPIAQPHIDSFEEIWENERDYLEVIDIDDTFADDLLDRLGSPPRPPEMAAGALVEIDDILDTVRRSPAYSVLSFDNVGLYPHQERVFVEGLSRWPVRVLLADEVGLGKTLEGGAILSYLLRFGGVEEVTILAPANLLKQWHEELYHHFGLEFWRWDSASRVFVSPEGRRWEGSMNGNPVGPEAPERVLISAQLARGTKKKGHIYEEVERFPDLLLVDEAHAARVRPTLDGSIRPTRLWQTLDDITDEIPHIVFLTATPLQTNLQEYHSLLELLGLPGIWGDLEAYERSLEILSEDEEARSLQNARWVLRFIESTVIGMGYRPEGMTPAEEQLLELAVSTEGNPANEAIMQARANWEAVYKLLVRLHPAHLLTIRNSRAGLVERGYRFPERVFESPALDVPIEVERFYDALQTYIWEAYGDVEKAANPDQDVSLGFTKSRYHQRTASSLHSAIRSLRNRQAKIDELTAGTDTDEEILEEEYEEPHLDEEDEYSSPTTPDEERTLERAKSIESTYISDLLGRLERLIEDDWIEDPKMDMMVHLLERHLPDDGVLVFSRYTDTLDACLEAFKMHLRSDLNIGYGMYTGGEAWISSGGQRRDATKEDVKIALEEREIGLIFCSEAAAEGLNLQAARVMINIDVPWNPAKLEQRIGRIARLGQPADEVLIYNLWYPDSVESKMYRRLTDRKDLYDIAVGQSPEIVSEAIRAQVSRDGEDRGLQAEDPLDKLGEVRQSMQHEAIQKVWGPRGEEIPMSTMVREELLELLAEQSPRASIEEGESGKRLILERPGGQRLEAGSQPEDRSILTLNHSVFEILSEARGILPSDSGLLVVEDAASEVPIALALDREERICVISPRDIPELIRRLLERQPVEEIVDEADWVRKRGPELREEIQERSRWLPDHRRMSIAIPEVIRDSLPQPVWLQEDELRLRHI